MVTRLSMKNWVSFVNNHLAHSSSYSLLPHSKPKSYPLFLYFGKKKKDFLFPCSGVLTKIILFLYLLESYLTNTYWRWMGMEHIWSCGAPRKFSWESYYNFFFFFFEVTLRKRSNNEMAKSQFSPILFPTST